MDYTTTAKTTRLNATVTQLGAAAEMVIGTVDIALGGVEELVVIPLNNPSFIVTLDEMEVNGLPIDTVAINTGTAALALIRTGGGTVIMENMPVGLLGTPGIDVIVNALEISTGQTVQVTIGVITHG